MKTAAFPVAMLLAGCLFLAAGCANSPPCRFYTLTATAGRASNPAGNIPSVAVSSVTIPELVDRPQLVVRSDGSRVEQLETHRWAEPLKGAISRTIAENISRLLPSDRVSSYPQNASLAADVRISVDMLRFESAGERVEVDALWTIRMADGSPVGSGRSRQTEAATGGGHDAAVLAFSRGLAGISGDIAQALRTRWPDGR